MQSERQQCLAWAAEQGLDVALITKTVVESIRSRQTTTELPENSLAQDMTVTDVSSKHVLVIVFVNVLEYSKRVL